MEDYNLPDNRKIKGDLEDALAINSIILFTTKIIYNVMKKNIFLNVKMRSRTFIFKKNIDTASKKKRKLFEKEYIFLCNVYEKKT